MGGEQEKLEALASALRQSEARVDDLQTRVAFQEQSIQELSDALSLQQRDLDQLMRQWRDVKERYESLQAQLEEAPGDEKPPHY